MKLGMKRLCVILLVAAMAGMTVGCGADAGKTVETQDEDNIENTTEAGAESDVDVQTVADEILNGGDFKDRLEAVDANMALTRLYNLDAAQVDASAFYVNSNATAEEIAVIKVKSDDYAETVRAAFEERIAAQKDACRDYLPDEMPKLENAVIYTGAGCVVLCISNDSGKAEALIENLLE